MPQRPISVRYLLVVSCVIGCGRDDVPPPPLPVAKPVAAPAAPPPPAAEPAVPAADLLSAIPADTGFVVAALDPVPEPVWQRVRAEVDLAGSTGGGPIARAALHELANGPSSVGLRPRPRVALYAAGAVLVLRVEVADPAKLHQALARIGVPASGVVDDADQAVAVGVANRVLAIAFGARDAVHAFAPHLGDAAPHPLAEATLRDFATQHHLTTYGVGWLEPAKLAPIVKHIPDFTKQTPACKTAILAAVAAVPPVAFGWSELSAARWAMTMSFTLDAATTERLAKATRDVPALPAVIPGQPLVAGALAALPSPEWTAPFERAEAACGDKAATFHLPAPWNTLTSGALVIYDGAWVSLLPGEIDGLLGVTGDAGAILAALGKWLPALAAHPPKDGGGFVGAMSPTLAGFLKDFAIARRGSQLVVATGPLGKAHAGDLAPRAAAPAFRLFLDIARIREREHAADKPRKLDDDEVYRGGDGDSEGAFVNLVGTFDMTITGGDLVIAGTFAPPHARAKPPSDPRFAIRDQCRAILRKAFAATKPALDKLGVTTELGGIESTYLTSIEADGAIRSCAKLTPAQRQCLAADPLRSAATCAPGNDFHPSALELPPLFSFFGPKPLEAVLHPPIDGAAIRAGLAGTWRSPSETWIVDGAGHVTIKEHDGDTRKRTLVFEAAGKVKLDDGDGGSETRSFLMLGPDRFTTEGTPVRVASEDRFIAPLGDGFLVREPGGCSVVTREGLLVAATCKKLDDALDVTWSTQHDTLRFVAGWLVDRDVQHDAFVRATLKP